MNSQKKHKKRWNFDNAVAQAGKKLKACKTYIESHEPGEAIKPINDEVLFSLVNKQLDALWNLKWLQTEKTEPKGEPPKISDMIEFLQNKPVGFEGWTNTISVQARVMDNGELEKDADGNVVEYPNKSPKKAFALHFDNFFFYWKNVEGQHPCGDLIQAWQKDATAMQVTKADDHDFPFALRLPFGSISIEEIEDAKDHYLPTFEPFEAQMMLDFKDVTSKQLAKHLPIRSYLADWNIPGWQGKPRGRRGAVPLWLRIFLEALVCGDRFGSNRTVFYELEYFYKLMYKKNAKWQKPQVVALRQMLDVASRAVIVLPDGGELLPVNFRYFGGLEKDSKVFVEVGAVRNTRQGALTSVEGLRVAYRGSNAGLQAYLSASEYIDRVWTRDGRMLYDTVPVKNDNDVILDIHEKPMTTKTGNPLKSLKGANKETLKRVKWQPNPKFTPSQIAIDELIRVCYPDSTTARRKAQKRVYKQRSLTAWNDQKIIDLKEVDGQHVIIRPSQEHRNNYRAVKRASEEARKRQK